jgi:hypothetical protein
MNWFKSIWRKGSKFIRLAGSDREQRRNKRSTQFVIWLKRLSIALLSLALLFFTLN